MNINKATSLESGIYDETWSDLVYKSFGENDLLYDAVETATVATTFPDTPFGKQLEIVAKLIQSREHRGNDRDVFYAKMPGFDSHGHLKMVLDGLTTELNGALDAFVTEIRDAQQVWDDVTVVVTSEFGSKYFLRSTLPICIYLFFHQFNIISAPLVFHFLLQEL